MKIDLEVDLHHLTRVEGHGDVYVRIEDGKVVEARWDVVETPRYFEVMLKGRPWTQAGLLSARICGICSISHCLASIRATERAFGVEVPPAAAKLRLLAKDGETLQSHYLHLLFLAAPDFLGLPSVLPLLEQKPAVVDLARRLRGAGNRLSDVVAGRTTHPVTLKVGGLTQPPSLPALRAVRGDLERSIADLDALVEIFAGFAIPDFVRETEFIALRPGDVYPSIGGRLASTDGVERAEDDYREMTNEYVDPRNTSKWARHMRESFAVGALARFNLNHALLLPPARALAERLGLRPVSHNPFLNNVAQLVECVHATHESLAMIDELLRDGMAEVSVPVTPRAAEGVGAVEAPRGILYHHYRYDGDGRIAQANCVIPTTQNNANIHLDLSALAAQRAAAGTTKAEMERLCSMLVRAYDPCVSCSVH
ncbi:MAG: Ni/Fe hydrogenase subunit alpha [Planctomycetota bacterium]